MEHFLVTFHVSWISGNIHFNRPRLHCNHTHRDTTQTRSTNHDSVRPTVENFVE